MGVEFQGPVDASREADEADAIIVDRRGFIFPRQAKWNDVDRLRDRGRGREKEREDRDI